MFKHRHAGLDCWHKRMMGKEAILSLFFLNQRGLPAADKKVWRMQKNIKDWNITWMLTAWAERKESVLKKPWETSIDNLQKAGSDFTV